MTENSKVHLNIQSRQFIGFKSLLILTKIRNLAYGVFVFGAFVSWGFCLWGFCLLGVLSLGFLSMGLLSVGLLYMGLPSAPRQSTDEAHDSMTATDSVLVQWIVNKVKIFNSLMKQKFLCVEFERGNSSLICNLRQRALHKDKRNLIIVTFIKLHHYLITHWIKLRLNSVWVKDSQNFISLRVHSCIYASHWVSMKHNSFRKITRYIFHQQRKNDSENCKWNQIPP